MLRVCHTCRKSLQAQPVLWRRWMVDDADAWSIDGEGVDGRFFCSGECVDAAGDAEDVMDPGVFVGFVEADLRSHVGTLPAPSHIRLCLEVEPGNGSWWLVAVAPPYAAFADAEHEWHEVAIETPSDPPELDTDALRGLAMAVSEHLLVPESAHGTHPDPFSLVDRAEAEALSRVLLPYVAALKEYAA